MTHERVDWIKTNKTNENKLLLSMKTDVLNGDVANSQASVKRSEKATETDVYLMSTSS